MISKFHYVYILQSVEEPDRHYVGMTQNLETGLKEHNAGECGHTFRFRPWQIETTVAFRSKKKAIAFERHLKSHSSRAFAKKHLQILQQSSPHT